MKLRSQDKRPALSAILVTPDEFETIRRTIKHLAAQSMCDQIEVVIVAPAGTSVDEAELRMFHSHRVVEVEAVHSIAAAYAVGVQAASAEIVAFTEDHSFPQQDWAAALVERHREAWAAVGPVVRNANPGCAVSWADFLIAYGSWHEATLHTGNVSHLPGHNSSYKRDVLLAYGERLTEMLAAESVLHWDLRARGYKLYLEPRARIAHLNFARFAIWARVQFHCGRVFAAARASGWALPKRLAYAGGSPLIPFVRLKRIAPRVASVCDDKLVKRRARIPGVWAALAVGLAIDAAGQMVGYTLHAGNSPRKLSEFEFHRHRYLAKHKL